MIFTKETHELVFDGFIIIDCAIRNHDRQMYLLLEDNDEKVKDGELRNTRILYTYLDGIEEENPEDRFFAMTLDGFMQL